MVWWNAALSKLFVSLKVQIGSNELFSFLGQRDTRTLDPEWKEETKQGMNNSSGWLSKSGWLCEPGVLLMTNAYRWCVVIYNYNDNYSGSVVTVLV